MHGEERRKEQERRREMEEGKRWREGGGGGGVEGWKADTKYRPAIQNLGGKGNEGGREGGKVRGGL